MNSLMDRFDVIMVGCISQGPLVEIQGFVPIFDSGFKLVHIAILDIAPRIFGKVGDQPIKFLAGMVKLPQGHIGVSNCPPHIVKCQRVLVRKVSAKRLAKINSVLEKRRVLQACLVQFLLEVLEKIAYKERLGTAIIKTFGRAVFRSDLMPDLLPCFQKKFACLDRRS